jgi:hypothetical protein
MFGKVLLKPKKYLLLAVCKNDIYHCGVYSNIYNCETITSINEGYTFNNLKDFVDTILETKSENEWIDCLYYNETKKRWRSVKYLLKKM